MCVWFDIRNLFTFHYYYRKALLIAGVFNDVHIFFPSFHICNDGDVRSKYVNIGSIDFHINLSIK